jgi:hypothetical protein
MGYCANTSPRAPTCPAITPTTWPLSPLSSTTDPAKPSAGKPPQKPSLIY